MQDAGARVESKLSPSWQRALVYPLITNSAAHIKASMMPEMYVLLPQECSLS